MMRTNRKWSVSMGMMLVVAGVGAEARDFNSLLQGEYMSTGAATCINSFTGFNSDFAPNPTSTLPPPFVHSFSTQAVPVLNGDGTGTVSGKNLFINSPNQFGFGAGASASTLSGEFTYTVEPDLSLTIQSAPFTSTATSGSGAGTQTVISNFPLFKGRISEDLNTIVIQHEMPGVETVTPAVGIPRQRICYRERILIRVNRGR